MKLIAALMMFGAAGGAYELSNNNVRLIIDAAGRLTELTNVQTGSRYVAAGGQAPWRMLYRAGEALELEIEPDGQRAQLRREGDTLVVSYDVLRGNLAHRGHTRDLQVALQVRVMLEGDRLTWTARIDNREPGIEITEIWVPWIAGLGDMGRGRAADVLYWPERAGRRIEAPQKKLAASPGGPPGGEGPSLRLTYPWPASMQWFTLNNGEEGLYFASHDQTLMTTCLNVMAHEGDTLSASIVKYPFVRTGETWTSQPAVTRLYRGDWHEAARSYRAWTDTWMRRPDPPAWIRRAPGWAHPALGRKSQVGHVRGSYADYPAMLKDARSVGIDTLIVFGWVRQGFDNRYPHYDPDETLGGAEGLRAALAEVKKAGGRTILYTQGQLIDPSTEFYRTKGKSIVARDVWGYEYREQYAQPASGTLLNVMRNKYFGVACPGARGWIDQLIAQYEMVRGLGAQGILYDQMGGIPPYICFSGEHPHEKPSLAVGPEKVRNMRRLREQMKARDPEFAFVIELVTDCYAGWVDIIHSHGIGFWPAPEAFGEMFRYTFPEPVITNRAGGPYDRRRQYGHAFALGWRFDASTRDARDPELGPYLARLCGLRNTYPDLLLEGRFVDTEGFLCDNSHVPAHGFVAGDRLAVTLWNPTDVPQRARVVAPGYVLEKAEWQDPGWSGSDRTLLPGDVAVLVFRRQ